MKKYWWQDAIIYQIYVRSFNDSNHDGIGDIPGIIQKLDYLKSLNVNTLWISPHYDSPMDDNGYDIRDFFKVAEEYGTMDDFKTLIEVAHANDMKIVTDLVLNHTSDEHPWFIAAKDPMHPEHQKYHDYYIWHKGHTQDDGSRIRPTRWISWFGGSVWDFNEPTDEYYLHIFSKKMPDLNWRNQAMREELKAMVQWWIDLGIDGFRIDASNHLEKNWDFPDDSPGYQHFSSLPKHHEYLKELADELFIPNNLLILGEAGGASKEEALQYAGFDSNEFNMLIHFGHVWVDTDDSNQLTPGKWAKGEVKLTKIKEALSHWIDVFHEKGWNTLYWHNHDHPRVVSHYGNDDPKYHAASAKMLATLLYFLPGTPIIYQGEEIGMTNVDYQNLNDFKDVEVFTEYENFMNHGVSHEVAMQALRDRARDNARSPMHWSSEPYAGFSDQTPWMPVVGNYPLINVANQDKDTSSILNWYRMLMTLRKEEAIGFSYPTFYHLDKDDRFAYSLKAKHHTYYIVGNFTSHPIEFTPDVEIASMELYAANQPTIEGSLNPYETRIYRQKNRSH